MSPIASESLSSILIPSDLTDATYRALDRLAYLPLAEHVRCRLLHVIRPGLRPDARRRAVRDANEALAAQARYLRTRSRSALAVDTVVTAGVPAKEILWHATELDVDLVVVSGGRGHALRDHFLGSTAERTLRRARAPVLVVQRSSRAYYQRPALSCDLEPSVQHLVDALLRVLPEPRPRVHVIHACEVALHGETNVLEHEVVRLRARRELTRLLADAFGRARIPAEETRTWTTHVACGAPHRVVERAIAAADTDLLILGQRDYAAAAYAFVGSVAASTLRETRCDVLVVPPNRSRARAGAARVLRVHGAAS